MLALVGKRNSSGDDANMARVMGQMEQDEVMARRLQVRLIMTRGLEIVLNVLVPFPTLLTGCKELFCFVFQIFVFSYKIRFLPLIPVLFFNLRIFFYNNLVYL